MSGETDEPVSPQRRPPSTEESIGANAHTVQRWASEIKARYGGLTKAGRSIAVAVTHLETAALWLKRAAEEAKCDGDESSPPQDGDAGGS